MRVRESVSAGASRGRSSLPFAAIVSHSLVPIPRPLLCVSIASFSASVTSVRYASFGSARIESSACAGLSCAIDAADPVIVRAPPTSASCGAERVRLAGVTCSSIRFSACSRLGSPELLMCACSVRSALSRPRSF